MGSDSTTKTAAPDQALEDDSEGMAKYAVSPDTLTKEATVGAEPRQKKKVSDKTPEKNSD